jgi:hypothetical protein
MAPTLPRLCLSAFFSARATFSVSRSRSASLPHNGRRLTRESHHPKGSHHVAVTTAGGRQISGGSPTAYLTTSLRRSWVASCSSSFSSWAKRLRLRLAARPDSSCETSTFITPSHGEEHISCQDRPATKGHLFEALKGPSTRPAESVRNKTMDTRTPQGQQDSF